MLMIFEKLLLSFFSGVGGILKYLTLPTVTYFKGVTDNENKRLKELAERRKKIVKRIVRNVLMRDNC